MGNCCSNWMSAVSKRRTSEVEPIDIADKRRKSEGRIFLTQKERTVILETWRRIDFDFTTRGTRILKLILTTPEIKALFTFGSLSNENMVNDPRFRAHACRFVQSVAAVIEELETADPFSKSSAFGSRTSMTAEELVNRGSNASDDSNTAWKVGQLLHTLGQAHAKIPKLTPELFKEVAESAAINAMLQVWREDLGRHWTGEAEAAWTKLFSFILRQVYEGLVMSHSERRASYKKRNSLKTSLVIRRSSAFFVRVLAAFREGRKWEAKASVNKSESHSHAAKY